MAEEIEAPTEHLHETLHEHAHGHGHGGAGGPPSWVSPVALGAAVMSVLAAVAALQAGHHANEAMIEQMQATDQWSYYQAKGVKALMLESKLDILGALAKDGKEGDRQKVDRYKEEQKEVEEKAREKEKSGEEHMHRHMILARAVTTFQVAIALSAIAVLSRKKWVWFVSLVVGAAGAAFLGQSYV
jgi:hypothetical protein